MVWCRIQKIYNAEGMIAYSDSIGESVPLLRMNRYHRITWIGTTIAHQLVPKNRGTCLNLYLCIDVRRYGVLFYVPILTHLFESFGSFIVKWLIWSQIAVGLIAWSSLRLVHVHIQNLYTTTHRPPADFRLHNRCWTSAYQLLCKRTTAVVRLKI